MNRTLIGLMVFFLFLASNCLAQPNFVNLVLHNQSKVFVYPDQNLDRDSIQVWKNYVNKVRDSYGSNGRVLPSSKALKDDEFNNSSVIVFGNPANNEVIREYMQLFDKISISRDEFKIGRQTFPCEKYQCLSLLLGAYIGQNKNGGNKYGLFCISAKDFPDIRKPIFDLAMNYDFMVSDVFGPLFMGLIDMSKETTKQFVDEDNSKLMQRPDFATLKTPHYQFFFEADNHIKSDKGWLAKFQEDSLRRIEEKLGIKCDNKLAFYLYNDEISMNKFTGNSGMGFADNFLPCVYAIYSDTIKGAIGAHEVAHILTAENWSETYPGGLIDEGCAEFTALSWNSKPHLFWVKEFLEKGSLPGILQLENNWDDFDENISYPVAACFIAYLKDRFGLATVKRLYQEAYKYENGGWISSVLKTTPEKLQKQFEQWICKN